MPPNTTTSRPVHMNDESAFGPAGLAGKGSHASRAGSKPTACMPVWSPAKYNTSEPVQIAADRNPAIGAGDVGVHVFDPGANVNAVFAPACERCSPPSHAMTLEPVHTYLRNAVLGAAGSAVHPSAYEPHGSSSVAETATRTPPPSMSTASAAAAIATPARGGPPVPFDVPLSDNVKPRYARSDHLQELAQVADPRPGPIVALQMQERRDVDIGVADLDRRHAEPGRAGELSVRAVAAVETVARLDVQRVARIPIDRRVGLPQADHAREDLDVDQAGERRCVPHRRRVRRA